MSIASEITRITGNIADAYTAANSKGATMPVTQDSDNLAATIATISSGGSSAVISAVTVVPSTSSQTITASSGVNGYSPVNVSAVTSAIDSNIVAGNIKNGVTILGVTGNYTGGGGGDTIGWTPRYLHPDGYLMLSPVEPDFTGVKEVEQSALTCAFINNVAATYVVNMSDVEHLSGSSACQSAFENSSITGVNLSSLNYVRGTRPCSSMFASCSSITNADLSSLVTIQGSYACYEMFDSNSSLSAINLPSLVVIANATGNNAAQYMFYKCSSATTLNVPNLAWVGLYGATTEVTYCLSNAFAGCTGLSAASFPKLGVIGGNNAFANAFSGCTSLQELSFPSLYNVSPANCSGFSNMLKNVSGCTVHFPSDFESTLSGTTVYNNGFGGTNTTILFDLPAANGKLDLSGIKEATYYEEFAGAFVNASTTQSIDLSGLEKITGYRSCANMFGGSLSSVTKIDISGLLSVEGDANGCAQMFCGLSSVPSVSFDSLKKLNAYYAFVEMFADSTGLFKDVYFPALRDLYNQDVSSNNVMQFYDMLLNVDGCTVHFPINMMPVLQYHSDVIARFGGTNITIAYDLPSTYIYTGVNGVEYERNPKYDNINAATPVVALRVNGTAVNSTTYYVMYNPVTVDIEVGDTIYSDAACTVAVTTISSRA